MTCVNFIEKVSGGAVFVCPHVDSTLSQAAHFWGVRCRLAEDIGQRERKKEHSAMHPTLVMEAGSSLTCTVLARLAEKCKVCDQNAFLNHW